MKARTAAKRLKSKRGRPRKDGAREPNGRLLRPRKTEPANKVAISARVRKMGITQAQASDQRAGTFIGYLNIIGSRDGLSNAQYDGATSYLIFRQRFLRAIKSPAAIYEREEGVLLPIDDGEYEDRCRAVISEMADLKCEIQEAQNTSRDNLLAALDLVVIQDQHLHHMIGATRLVCNVLAKHFKTDRALALR